MAEDIEPVRDVAVVVVSTDSDTLHTGWRVVWYPLTESEACAICSDPRTAGKHYMMCWTRDLWKWKWYPDDGRHDVVLADLGIEKPSQVTVATETPSQADEQLPLFAADD